MSSPRNSRRAYVTNSAVTRLRQVMSKSVLSKGLAMRAASAAASAMVSEFKERPSRNFEAPSATSGRDDAEPIAMRASSTTPLLERRAAAATDNTGKSNEPRRRNFQ